jgi:integrase
MRLTIRSVDALAASNAIHWDDDVKGFGIRVKPSGVKSYVVQYRNAQGTSKRLTIGQHGTWTPELARDRAKELLREADLGNDPVHAKLELHSALTIEQLCREYIEKMDAGLILARKGKPKKPSGVYNDKSRIERHIIPLLGKRLVREVTPPMCRRFMEDVATGKAAAVTKTKLRGKSVVTGGNGVARRTMGLLGGIFTYAVEQGHIATSPARGIRRAADNVRDIRLGPDDYRTLQRLLAKAALGQPWQAVKCAQLIALTGMRKGEATHLRPVEIDYAKRLLRLGDTKTGQSIRPLGEAAIRLLKSIEGQSAHGYVFPCIRGTGKPYSGIEKVWAKMVPAEHGWTLHTLRHSFASVANDLGYTESTIGALLGHASQGVTKGYIHQLDNVILACADKVSNSIWEMMTHEKVDAKVVKLR